MTPLQRPYTTLQSCLFQCQQDIYTYFQQLTQSALQHKRSESNHNLIRKRELWRDNPQPYARPSRLIMIKPYRSKAGQKGEAEILLFATVWVVCCLISGALWLFGWVKDSKDGKVDRRLAAQIARQSPAPFVPRLDPGEYYVSCTKPLWAALSSDASCAILPESYRELEITP